MAPSPLDPTLNANTSGPTGYPWGDSDSRRADGRGESSLGSTSNPRGIGQAGHRGLGTNGLTAPATTPSPTVTDLANVPDESRGRSGVDGLLYRADPHRPRAIRARVARPPPSPDRAPRDHRAPHGHVDRATDH